MTDMRVPLQAQFHTFTSKSMKYAQEDWRTIGSKASLNVVKKREINILV
jgi:hypothetical protein